MGDAINTSELGELGARTVAIVSNDLGYVTSFRGPVIERLRRRGCSVTVIAPASSERAADRAAELGAEWIDWRLRKWSRNPLHDVGALAALVGALRRLRPQAIYADTIKPVVFALAAGRVVGTPRRVVMLPGLGYAFIEEGGLARRATALSARLAYGLALPSAHKVIFHNPDDAALFLRHGLVRDPARAEQIDGSGVDLSHFARQPAPPGPPVFGMISRLLRDKGVAEYAAAARLVRRRFPAARFLLAGRLDANPAAIPEADLRGWISAGDIDFLGELADVRPTLAACHAFVLPSYREGLPRTCLEAMAVGRAIVASDAPGCREVVVEGLNGRLAAPRDAGALADVLRDLAGDVGAMARMGAASRRLCEARFDVEIIAERMANLITGGSAAPDHEVCADGSGVRQAELTQKPAKPRHRLLAAR